MATQVVFFDLGGTLILPGAHSVLDSTLLPRTLDVLQFLEMQHVVLGIISNAPKSYVPDLYKVLAKLKILKYFRPSLIIFSGEVNTDKSSTKIFEKAKRNALALYPKAQFAFVDDEAPNLERARAVGFATFSSPLDLIETSGEPQPKTTAYSALSAGSAEKNEIQSWPKTLTPEQVEVLTSVVTVDSYRNMFGKLRVAGGGNRNIEGPNIDRFTKFLATTLEECGKERQPGFDFFTSITEPFTISKLYLSNVVGEIKGESDEILLLGAHFDSTAKASFGRKYDPATDPAPGADDNLSGVIAVLLAARAFCKLYASSVPKYTLQFVFFNAEEVGLVGSDVYAKTLKNQGKTVVAALTNDMIGYRKKATEDYAVEVHIGTKYEKVGDDSKALADHFTNVVNYLVTQKIVPKTKIIPFSENDLAEDSSDHSSFHKCGWPAMVLSEQFFSDEQNPNYHKISDVKIDIPFATNNSRLLFAAACAATAKKSTRIPLAGFSAVDGTQKSLSGKIYTKDGKNEVKGVHKIQFYFGENDRLECVTDDKGEFKIEFTFSSGDMHMIVEDPLGNVMHKDFPEDIFHETELNMHLTFTPNSFPSLTDRYVNIGKHDILEKVVDDITVKQLEQFIFMNAEKAQKEVQKWKIVGGEPEVDCFFARFQIAQEIANVNGFADFPSVLTRHLDSITPKYPSYETDNFVIYYDNSGVENEGNNPVEIREPITRDLIATVPGNGAPVSVQVVEYWLQTALNFYTNVIGFKNPARDRKIPVLVLTLAKEPTVFGESWSFGFATQLFFQIDRNLTHDQICAVSVHELFHMVQYSYYDPFQGPNQDWKDAVTEGGATTLEDGVEKSLKRYLDESIFNFNMGRKLGLLLNPNWDVPDSSYKFCLLIRYISEQRAQYTPTTIGAQAYRNILEYFEKEGDISAVSMEDAVKSLSWHGVDLTRPTEINIEGVKHPMRNETTIANFALALLLKNLDHGDRRFGFQDNTSSIGLATVIPGNTPKTPFNTYSAPAPALSLGVQHSDQVNRLGTIFFQISKAQLQNIRLFFSADASITLQVVLLTKDSKIHNIFRRNTKKISKTFFLSQEVDKVYIAVTGRETDKTGFVLSLNRAGPAPYIFVTNWNSEKGKWFHKDPYLGNVWDHQSVDISITTNNLINATVHNQGNDKSAKLTASVYLVRGDLAKKLGTAEVGIIAANSLHSVDIKLTESLSSFGTLAVVVSDSRSAITSAFTTFGNPTVSRFVSPSPGGGRQALKSVAPTTTARLASYSEPSPPPEPDPDRDKFSFSYTDNARVAAWFLGPRGENVDFLLKVFTKALEAHVKWRQQYFPEDPVVINHTLTEQPEFHQTQQLIESTAQILSEKLRNSMPFFSPRYKGHMSYEPSLPGMVGYFVGMLYNNNNVAAEGAPVTTELELEVGLDLCKMLGYTINKSGQISAWGHITSCGSVANIESLWAARSCRFLTVAIKKAMQDPQCIFGSLNLKVTTCANVIVNVKDASDWDLINVTMDEQLKLLTTITSSIPEKDKKTALSQISVHDVQHVGLPSGKPAKYFVPVNRHYSWDKAGALLGIGQSNMILVNIGDNFRQDLSDLEAKLNDCLKNQNPVLQVMGLIGSTGEGAVDDLLAIINLREKFRLNGLDFYIHADAAWGGYFATMQEKPKPTARASYSSYSNVKSDSRKTPSLPLSNHVRKQLVEALPLTDSITIDPHKAGYVQYPAGALCYRNDQVLSLIQFSAEYLFNRGDSSMGLYGIEGSKPGAAASAVWLQHKIIPLNPTGHGQLCGQANWTGKRLYCVLATLAEKDDPFKIEMGVPVPEGVTRAELQSIATLSNTKIAKNHRLLQVMSLIGSDLLINVFTVNFKWPLLAVVGPQEWNTSLKLANDVTGAIASDLNMAYTSTSSDTTTPIGASRKPLFLIRNSLPLSQQIAKKIADRLIPSQKHDDDKIGYLVNTNMDPWATSIGFFETFKFELRQAILRGVGRIKETPHLHAFVMCDIGSEEEVHGDHLPVFTESIHNYHLVVKIKLVGVTVSDIRKFLEKKSSQSILIANKDTNKKTLYELIHNGVFDADIVNGFETGRPIIYQDKPVKAAISDVVVNHHFDPTRVIFPSSPNEEYVLFGSATQKITRVYMSRVLYKKPDMQFLVELTEIPKCFSNFPKVLLPAEFLDLGVHITISDIPRINITDEQVNEGAVPLPLQVGTVYNFTFIQEGIETCGELKVKRVVWFDYKLLNAESHHH